MVRHKAAVVDIVLPRRAPRDLLQGNARVCVGPELAVVLHIRSADAIHLVSAAEADETEIWTADRGMLVAAPGFGLTGRSVLWLHFV